MYKDQLLKMVYTICGRFNFQEKSSVSTAKNQRWRLPDPSCDDEIFSNKLHILHNNRINIID